MNESSHRSLLGSAMRRASPENYVNAVRDFHLIGELNTH
jgi:hypothetical protein